MAKMKTTKCKHSTTAEKEEARRRLEEEQEESMEGEEDIEPDPEPPLSCLRKVRGGRKGRK